MPIPGRPQEAGTRLARALVHTSILPLLLFDGDLKIVTASRSFCTAFDVDFEQIEGRGLSDLSSGAWNIPQLHSLLESALQDELHLGPYETDLPQSEGDPRRLVLEVQKVDYGDADHPRVLLAITDITDFHRADRQVMTLLFEKDDLLRERAVLLQEMQHRVANSLQIIASILMLKARTVKSEETRLHLRDAHDRVMSVAAVQQHLQSHVGEVELAPYLSKLCASLASSMIRESRSLVLEVRADDATVSSHEAVSLGLIVTELVINALKHAFPEGRGGLVLVGYDLAADGWTLSVTDDGVGRPVAAAEVRVGLGTSVVEALARQLGAQVTLSDAAPGAKIAIVNSGGAR